jgi:hypothetical protein
MISLGIYAQIYQNSIYNFGSKGHVAEMVVCGDITRKRL